MNAITKPNFSQRLARFTFGLNRFRTLQRANGLFGKTPANTVFERSLFGYRFLCDVSQSGPPRLIYLEGERFIPEAKLILSLLRPGFRIVDVGANIGYYTLMFCSGIGKSGKILAIEPSPENLPSLRANVAHNRLEKQVQIVPAAVGDRTEIVGLRAGINSGVTSDGDKAYSVPLDKLDNLVKGRVDFMKMDIEGYEAFALKGAKRILTEYRPILFVEIHPVFLRSLGSTAAAVVEQLYEIYGQITAYEQRRDGDLLRKFAQRYLGIGLIRRIENLNAYVRQPSVDKAGEPFWAICRDRA